MSVQPSAPIVALEISPLADRAYSGISNVTKAIAREMLCDDTISAKFFICRSEVPRAIVERLVYLDRGDVLWWLADRLDGHPRMGVDWGRACIAIYPGIKRHRRLFPTEVQILHDLTAVVTPHFHSDRTLETWQRHALGDLLSSDLIVAVSEATQADLRTFFPEVSHVPCIVAENAVEVGDVASLPGGRQPLDYALVLGTLEPRKNGRLILKCIAEHPEILDELAFVFAGQSGWGASVRALIKDYGLSGHVADQKIIFTGFVSNEARDELISAARLVIYPSRYEGFGLPVLEALHLGTPVLTTYSSSLPEAGGDVAAYCDADSSAAFYEAIKSCILMEPSAEARQRRIGWAEQFSWKATYEKIKNAALAIQRPDLTKP